MYNFAVKDLSIWTGCKTLSIKGIIKAFKWALQEISSQTKTCHQIAIHINRKCDSRTRKWLLSEKQIGSAIANLFKKDLPGFLKRKIIWINHVGNAQRPASHLSVVKGLTITLWVRFDGYGQVKANLKSSSFGTMVIASIFAHGNNLKNGLTDHAG